MSTLTMKPTFPILNTPDSTRDTRQQELRATMRPRRERIIALTVGTIAVTLFSVLAPMVGDPAERLSALDATPTIATDATIATERPFEFAPSLMGPAITFEALMLAEDDAVYMPPLDVRVTADGEEVVRAPEG